MKEELRKFHTVPEAQRLSPDEKDSLVNPILEGEVLSAINQLPTGKSGEMVECLTMVYRAIRKGAEVPRRKATLQMLRITGQFHFSTLHITFLGEFMLNGYIAFYQG
ncbi:Endonuclease [Phytophthora palmivora]|uniref:Endonuclease n=1 Tax=Phytophthora palmivora TaxID=4796 RepID=A0A2P4YIE6_9STRA|nr:Endonuclease [Phytophthora palmivora]